MDNFQCDHCKSVYFVVANKFSAVQLGATVANTQILKCVGCDNLYEILDGKLVRKSNFRA